MLFSERRIEAIQEPMPEWAFSFFALVTDLGDPLFFILLVSLVFWLTDHETGLWVIVALLLVFGLTVGLKELFAIERPPTELQYISDEGFGIPSGHTSGAVATYGALAVLYDAGPRWLRYALATVVSGMVALSRLVLGVHYVADVVAGAVLGGLVLWTVLAFRNRSPLPFFVLAAGGSLVGAVLSDFTYSPSLLLFGGAVAALATWPFISPLATPPRRVMLACSVVGLPLVVGISFAGIALVAHPLALVGSTAVAMSIVLGMPTIGTELAARLDSV